MPQAEKDSKERDSALQVAADTGSMRKLLKYVEHSGEHLSEQNVVTSFLNLAKLADSKNDGQLESLYGEAPFLTLVGKDSCSRTPYTVQCSSKR